MCRNYWRRVIGNVLLWIFPTVWFAQKGISALILCGDSVWEFCVWLLNGFCIVILCRNSVFAKNMIFIEVFKILYNKFSKDYISFCNCLQKIFSVLLTTLVCSSNFGKCVPNYDYQFRICTLFSNNLTYCSNLLQDNIFFIAIQFDWSNFGKSIQINIVILTFVNHLH